MDIKLLKCPSCGAPLPEDFIMGQPFTCDACGSMLLLADLDAPPQIRCTACGTFNPELLRFCERCGELLQDACPFCFTGNPIGALKCKHCGANLASVRQRRDAWLQSERQHRDEKRAALSHENHQMERINRLIDDLEEPENHEWAIYSLLQFGADSVESLVVALNDEDPDARFGSAKALGLIGDARAVPGLIAALKDEEPAVRFWAADALGKLNAAEAVDALAACLNDEHVGVREQASHALEAIGTPEAQRARRKRPRWWPL